jgi:sterol desaturase/sphingolipid hydroxylase (fatty acid hydroxylase superfamily)
MKEILAFFSTNSLELVSYLTDANKRIFWLYLASSLALALGVYLFQSKKQNSHAALDSITSSSAKKGLFNFLAFIFPKAIYTHKSAQHDYLLITNKLIKAALFPIVILTMAPIALGLSAGLEFIFGQREFIELSALNIMLTFTLILFLFDDFSRFLLHYLLHKFSFLWEFHKVHHSAKVLTPFTIYRSHPVENYLYACRMALTQGAAVGIGYYLFGPTLKMFDILGANLFVFLFNFCGSNLRHSHIWLSWGNKIEGWLISPAQHQIHHSDQPKYHHSNFGSALALWDRLFKTHRYASEIEQLTFGLKDNLADHSSLAKIYLQPFNKIAKKISKKR